MSVRRSDGVDDWLHVAIGDVEFAGAYTLALLVRAPSGVADDQVVVVGHNSGGSFQWVFGGTSAMDSFQLYIGSASDAPAGFLPAGVWRLIGFSKAAGTSRPRMHTYDFIQERWSHADGTVAIGDPATQAGGEIGFFALGRRFNFSAVDLAAAAAWTSALSDTAFEALADVVALSEWADHAPGALWLFDQASVADPLLDVIGAADELAINGTTVVAQDPPVPYEPLPTATVMLNVGGSAVACELYRNVGGEAVPVTGHTALPHDGSFLGFASHPPPAGWHPYSNASPFNQPLVDPVVHPQSAQFITTIVDYVTAEGGRIPGNLHTEQAADRDFAHPIYYARPDDPELTIDAGSYAASGHRIRVPAAARATVSTDAHIAVVQPGGWVYEAWNTSQVGSGVLRAQIVARQRYDGLALVTPEMQALDRTIGGTTASYFGHHAGLIRGPELAAGEIRHALFCSVFAGAWDLSFGYGVEPGIIADPTGSHANARYARGDGSVLWPAYKGDAADRSLGVLAPMGAWFWLEMTDDEIAATAAPAWEKTIARAMARYGAIFGDTGGPGFGLMFESGLMYTALGRTNPLRTVAVAAGLRLDPTYGYTFVFGTGDENAIPWADRLRVIVPQEVA